MAPDLETGLLRAFVTAAHTGSISRAAVALGQTQPGLSQQLRKLERTVGRPLLHRSPLGVSLTPAGEALMSYAERILSLSAQALAESRRSLAGHCGVGLIEDLAATLLPQALADFARVHPDTTLEVMALPGPAMASAFAEGRIQVALCDAAYFAQPPRWTVRVPLVWAIGHDLDLALDPLPLVLFSQPCQWRSTVLETLERAGRRWRVAFESTNLLGVQAAVRANLGAAALMPANVDAGLIATTSALPSLPDVEIGLVRRAGSDGDPLIDAVEELLRRLA